MSLPLDVYLSVCCTPVAVVCTSVTPCHGCYVTSCSTRPRFHFSSCVPIVPGFCIFSSFMDVGYYRMHRVQCDAHNACQNGPGCAFLLSHLEDHYDKILGTPEAKTNSLVIQVQFVKTRDKCGRGVIAQNCSDDRLVVTGSPSCFSHYVRRLEDCFILSYWRCAVRLPARGCM